MTTWTRLASFTTIAVLSGWTLLAGCGGDEGSGSGGDDGSGARWCNL